MVVILPRKKDVVLFEKRRLVGYGETIRRQEFDDILAKLGRINYVDLRGNSWQCLAVIAWLTGKRISEIVQLHTTDIWVDDDYLNIQFRIMKKNRRPKNTEPLTNEEKRLLDRPRSTKKITLSNPYVEYVIGYVDSFSKPSYFFPRENTATGFIYPKYFWDVIKKLELRQPIWAHLFRHSLATRLAEEGITAWELKQWFNWSTIALADKYVSSAGMDTPNISDRSESR